MTGDFVRHRDANLRRGDRVAAIATALGDGNLSTMNANLLAAELAGDTIYANVLLLGGAWQMGLVPVSLDALLRAIELNGVAIEANRRAFDWGRIAAAKPVEIDGPARRRGRRSRRDPRTVDRATPGIPGRLPGRNAGRSFCPSGRPNTRDRKPAVEPTRIDRGCRKKLFQVAQLQGRIRGSTSAHAHRFPRIAPTGLRRCSEAALPPRTAISEQRPRRARPPPQKGIRRLDIAGVPRVGVNAPSAWHRIRPVRHERRAAHGARPDRRIRAAAGYIAACADFGQSRCRRPNSCGVISISAATEPSRRHPSGKCARMSKSRLQALLAVTGKAA